MAAAQAAEDGCVAALYHSDGLHLPLVCQAIHKMSRSLTVHGNVQFMFHQLAAQNVQHCKLFKDTKLCVCRSLVRSPEFIQFHVYSPVARYYRSCVELMAKRLLLEFDVQATSLEPYEYEVKAAVPAKRKKVAPTTSVDDQAKQVVSKPRDESECQAQSLSVSCGAGVSA